MKIELEKDAGFDFIFFDGGYIAVLVLNTSRVCRGELFRLSSM